MPSIGRPFKREGVPRKELALAALGVDVEGSKDDKGLERERKGAKGLDEIGLSAAEQIEVKEAEGIWDRERMVAWAKTIGNDETYNEEWVDNTFQCLPDGTIRSKEEELYLRGTQVKEIPPGLQVRVLGLGGTQVKEIPPGLQVEELHLRNTQVEEIPPGLQVKVLNLTRTQVKEIPDDKGAIQKIWVRSSQTELKASAEARGIEVQTL